MKETIKGRSAILCRFFIKSFQIVNGFPSTSLRWTYWKKSSKRSPRWLKDWSTHGVVERTGTLYPIEGNYQGGILSVYIVISKGTVQTGCSQALPSGAQQQNKRQRAQTRTLKVNSEHQKALFLLWEWPSTGADLPSVVVEYHPRMEIFKNPKWSWAIRPRWPCLSRRVGLDRLQRSSPTSSHSAIL